MKYSAKFDPQKPKPGLPGGGILEAFGGLVVVGVFFGVTVVVTRIIVVLEPGIRGAGILAFAIIVAVTIGFPSMILYAKLLEWKADNRPMWLILYWGGAIFSYITLLAPLW